MHIVVGLSGGVDSSVTAYLLKQQGYEVTGIFMKNWEEDDTAEFCSASRDIEDAAHVCEKLNIPFHTINFATEYWDNVFSYFLNEYQKGRTPNPDILCNKEIKFKCFLDYAKQLQADKIATGHYAGIQYNHSTQEYELHQAADLTKDQSYFLYALDQSQLSMSLFPLTQLHKKEVRAIAHSIGLENSAKKDSTGICFIGERKFKSFLAQYLPAQPGDMITENGDVIGRHDGLMYYTIGQRQGLGIGGRQSSADEPWYVARKDLITNKLIVVQGAFHPLLFQQDLICQQIHLINDLNIDGLKCSAKIRYRQQEQACLVTKISEKEYQVRFDEPQRAVTPGQSIVFYHGTHCLGGAIIA